jgi:lipopolysaccharide export system protein LptA
MQMRQAIRPALIALLLAVAGPAAAQIAVGFGGVAHDAEQAVEVVADTLSIDQTTGRAVFAGNVIILQGDLRIAAGRVEVVYSEAEGQRGVDEVIASGGVLVTRGEDAAEGDEARYEIAAALLSMAGDVMVTQGATTIAGDTMVIDMATGNGTVGGRVRTVLTPERQP